MAEVAGVAGLPSAGTVAVGSCDGCGRPFPAMLLHETVGPEGAARICWSCVEELIERSGIREPRATPTWGLGR